MTLSPRFMQTPAVLTGFVVVQRRERGARGEPPAATVRARVRLGRGRLQPRLGRRRRGCPAGLHPSLGRRVLHARLIHDALANVLARGASQRSLAERQWRPQRRLARWRTDRRPARRGARRQAGVRHGRQGTGPLEVGEHGRLGPVCRGGVWVLCRPGHLGHRAREGAQPPVSPRATGARLHDRQTRS